MGFLIGALNTALNNGFTNMSGSSKILLGMMVEGMVLPCAIALATILFKNKFTKEERESDPMSLS